MPTFVVEDGSGLQNANSYADVAYADAYFDNVGSPAALAAWSGLDTAGKQAALRQGTRYMEIVYRNKWMGRRVSQLQALAWPRAWVEDAQGFALGSNVLPKIIADVTCELAVRSVSADLLADIASPGVIVSESVGLGSGAISTSTTYSSAGKSQVPWRRTIDLLVNEFIDSNGLVQDMERA